MTGCKLLETKVADTHIVYGLITNVAAPKPLKAVELGPVEAAILIEQQLNVVTVESVLTEVSEPKAAAVGSKAETTKTTEAKLPASAATKAKAAPTVSSKVPKKPSKPASTAQRVPARDKALKLWATHYYVQHAQDAGKYPLLDADNKPLGPKLSQQQWCYAAREGTVRVGNNLYNYDGRSKKRQVDCSEFVKLPAHILALTERVRFKKTSAPYGLGVKSWQLVPYRTVAVDPKRIPFGTVLYIPAADGVVVGESEAERWVHDGYFFAGDTGSAISGEQVDVFIGTAIQNPFTALKRSTRKATLLAYTVTDAGKIRALQDAHEGYVNLAKR